jgi:ankyrin repeat protein
VDQVNDFLRSGEDPSQGHDDYITPVSWAIANGNERVLRTLLAYSPALTTDVPDPPFTVSDLWTRRLLFFRRFVSLLGLMIALEGCLFSVSQISQDGWPAAICWLLGFGPYQLQVKWSVCRSIRSGGSAKGLASIVTSFVCIFVLTIGKSSTNETLQKICEDTMRWTWKGCIVRWFIYYACSGRDLQALLFHYLYLKVRRQDTQKVSQPGLRAVEAVLASSVVSESMMLALLDAGLPMRNINDPRGYVYSLWICATRRGWMRAAEVIKERGVPVDARVLDPLALTALCYAAQSGNQHFVQWLLDLGAHIDGMSPTETPLLLLMECEPSAKNLISLLISYHANANARDCTGRSVLSWAAQPSCQSETIGELITAGADPNVADRDGKIPLHYAAQSGASPETVRLLLSSGSDVGARDSEQKIPLHYAAERTRDAETIRLLLLAGSDVDARDEHDISALT